MRRTCQGDVQTLTGKPATTGGVAGDSGSPQIAMIRTNFLRLRRADWSPKYVIVPFRTKRDVFSDLKSVKICVISGSNHCFLSGLIVLTAGSSGGFSEIRHGHGKPGGDHENAPDRSDRAESRSAFDQAEHVDAAGKEQNPRQHRPAALAEPLLGQEQGNDPGGLS